MIDSHTDGTNAVEDNGPIAMVAMARYLASLPMRCRPRTVEFSFSTAHFYQRVADPDVRDGGAEQLAERLDHAYDRGTVSAVLVLEHLGAIDYEAAAPAGWQARGRSPPGRNAGDPVHRRDPEPPARLHGRLGRAGLRHEAHDPPAGRRRPGHDHPGALQLRWRGDALQPAPAADDRRHRRPADPLRPRIRGARHRLRCDALGDARVHRARQSGSGRWARARSPAK